MSDSPYPTRRSRRLQDAEATPPQLFGIYEGNDKKKRLMAIINYNVDVSDFWQFSADGELPVLQQAKAEYAGLR